MATWKNKSPGDLSVELSEVSSGDVTAAVECAARERSKWGESSLDHRCEALKAAQAGLTEKKDSLAHGIALETGKPIKEAAGEIAAVIAKIDLAIADARKYLAEESFNDNPHENSVRRRPRGVAAVIGPFNFPIHLAHGAIVAYLLAGNTVVFKPSPLAANVCAQYGRIMTDALGPAFQIVQGGATEGQQLVTHPAVRSVCFTGSVAAGRAIARAVVDDVGKDVALELGGKNAAIVCRDADLDLAATAIAEAMCLTAGQRCNSTSRVIVDREVEADLIDRLKAKLAKFAPGDPLKESTRLGPLISDAAKQKYLAAIARPQDWIIRGGAPETVGGKRGHYVLPAVVRLSHADRANPLLTEEIFAPVLAIVASQSEQQSLDLTNATPFGLTASIFTADRERFLRMSRQIDCGNVYMNLPTTFSPGTLPFGGLKESGNRHPGGRGFIRFATDEQVLQMKR